MIYLLLLLIPLVFGCKALDKKIVRDSSVTHKTSADNSGDTMAPPHMVWIHWPAAVDSDSTVYGVMATTNLIDWNAFVVTEDTNAYAVPKDHEFYAVYSSNTLTQQAMWATNK